MTEKEYNECVGQFADNVYRFIVKNLKHEEDARDIVQSSFEKLWRNCRDVDFARSKSYLFTIAYHEMIDFLRKKRRVQYIQSLKEDAGSYVQPGRNLKKVLEEAMSRLNDTQRSLVMLKDYEGYSYAEIGQITGLNESQVKVYLHRARIQLKNYLVSPQHVV
jgi:RNA polymerase sigma factor (sigma-70 family)